MEFYSIIQTRVNGYHGLMEALEANKQTGALKILQEAPQLHASSSKNLEYLAELLLNFPVQMSGVVKPLQELLPAFTCKDALEALQTPQIRKEFLILRDQQSCSIDLDGTIPVQHKLYIPRYISNRIMLEKSVFGKKVEDVFVFHGIGRTDLARLTHPHLTRSSTSQRNCITCRHLFLDDEEDWDDLLLVTEKPMHMIKKEGDDYVLHRSTEVTDTILNHTISRCIDKAAYISEEDFLNQLEFGSNSKGALLCDIPGMGKTWLMESLCRKFRQETPQALIFLIQLSRLGRSLDDFQKLPKDGDTLKHMFKIACKSKLSGYILTNFVQTTYTDVVFFLDGFDEIRDSHVSRTTRFLKDLNREENVNLIISSRPHMRYHLEKTFNLVSFDILPFGREEQVAAVIGQWQENAKAGASQGLTEYANICITSIRHIQQPMGCDILGVPLRCYILAVVNEKHALQLSSSKRFKRAASSIKSICDLYEKFVDVSIQKAKRVHSDKPASGNQKDVILRFHMHKAIELLFPEISSELMPLNTKGSQENPAELLHIGILSADHLEFVHRSFAEYFAGKFFADFWINIRGQSLKYLECVAIYFLETVLKSDACLKLDDCERVKYSLPNLRKASTDSERKKFQFSSVLWFVNSISRTTVNSENQMLSIKAFRDILYPKAPKPNNLKMTPKTLPNIKKKSGFKSRLIKQMLNILVTCIDEGLTNVLTLVVQLTKSVLNEKQVSRIFVVNKVIPESIDRFHSDTYKYEERAILPYLLYLTAFRGNPEAAHEISQLFDTKEKNNLLDFCQNFPEEFISPIEVAIVKNDMDTFVYFLDKFSIPCDRLLLCCMRYQKLSEEEVNTRVSIFDCVVAREKSYEGGLTSALYRQYLQSVTTIIDYWPLVLFSFNNNIRFKHLTPFCKRHLLRTAFEELGDSHMIQLLLILFERHTTSSNEVGKEICLESLKVNSLDNFNDRQGKFVAWKLLQHINLSEANKVFTTLDLNSSMISRDFQDIEILKTLVRVCSDFSLCNKDKYGYLHLAVANGLPDWVEYLLKIGEDVNKRASMEETPLHLIGGDQLVKITRLLVDNGADAYAVNSSKSNVAHILLNKLENRLRLQVAARLLGRREQPKISDNHFQEWVEYMLDAGHSKLWSMADHDEISPFEQMVRIFGVGHEISKTVLCHITSLNDLPTSAKLNLLNNSISKHEDKDFLQLLLLLFSKAGLEIVQAEFYQEDWNEQLFLQSLNPDEAKKAFVKVRVENEAFMHMKDLQTLKVLVALCPHFIHCNAANRNYLHYAAQQGKAAWARQLIHLEYNVNEKDKFGNTPLLCIEPQHPSCVEITDLLRENGANVYEMNDTEHENVAHLMLKKSQSENLNIVSDWVAFTMKKDMHNLWHMKTIHERTPLELVANEAIRQVVLLHTFSILDHSPTRNRDVLEEAIARCDDNQIMQHLMILFPLPGIDASSYENDVLDKHKSDNVLKYVDISDINETLQELQLNVFTAFRNMHKIETLKIFMEICQDFTTSNRFGMNYLHIAVHHGKTPWVHYLCENGADVNQTDSDGNTPLMYLPTTDAIEMTRVLIEKGANVYAVNRAGQNVAHVIFLLFASIATNTDDSTILSISEWMVYMIENGHIRLWNMKDSNHSTPFDLNTSGIVESQFARLESLVTNTITKWLLSWPRNQVNLKPKRSNRDQPEDSITPLVRPNDSIENVLRTSDDLCKLFSSQDDREMLILLIDLFPVKKNEINAQNIIGSAQGQNVWKCPPWKSVFLSLDIIAAHEALVRIPSETSKLFLNMHCTETCKLLISLCPDYTRFNKSNRNYLHYTPLMETVDIPQFLITCGHDVNQQDINGYTPLCYISVKSKLEIISLLVENGADAFATSTKQETSAHCLSKACYPEHMEEIIKQDKLIKFATLEKVWGCNDRYQITPMGRILQISKNCSTLTNNSFTSIDEIYNTAIKHASSPEAKIIILKESLTWCRDEQVIRTLLAFFGIGTEQQNFDNTNTSKFIAEESSSSEILQRLNISDAKNMLHQLFSAGQMPFKYVRHVQTLKVFIGICPDFSQCNLAGLSYMCVAAYWGKTSWLHYLIGCGHDVNYKDAMGCTPLLCISTKEAVEVTSMLLDAGADVWSVDKFGNNVSHKLILECDFKSHSDKAALRKWTMFMMEGGYHIFEKKNDDNKTAIDLIKEKVGENHPLPTEILSISTQIGKNLSHSLQADITRSKQQTKSETLKYCLENFNDKNFMEELLRMFGKCGGDNCAQMKIQNLAGEGAETMVKAHNYQATELLQCLDIESAKNVITTVKIDLVLFKDIRSFESLKVLNHICPDFTTCNTDDVNYLHCAVICGRPDWTQYLIENGHDVNQRTKHGTIPLHWLYLQHTVTITKLLLNAGTDVHAVDNYNNNVVHSCFGRYVVMVIEELQAWVVHLMENGYQSLWNGRNSEGRTPFEVLFNRTLRLLATESINNVQHLLFLLNEGFHMNVNKTSNIDKPDNHSLVKLVFHHKYSLTHLSCENKASILNGAFCKSDDDQMIQILLLLFPKYDDSTSTLKIPANENPMLCSYAPDNILPLLCIPHARESFSKLKLDPNLALKNILKLETLEVLTTICTDFRQCNTDNANYLNLAVNLGRVDWVDYLIKKSYDVNQPDIDGDTPLHLISVSNPVQITKMLIANGANVYAVDKWKYNVAHRLILRCKSENNFNGLLEWVKFMIDAGYDSIWNMRAEEENQRKTPFEMLTQTLGANHIATKMVLSRIQHNENSETVINLSKEPSQLTEFPSTSKGATFEEILMTCTDEDIIQQMLIHFGKCKTESCRHGHLILPPAGSKTTEEVPVTQDKFAEDLINCLDEKEAKITMSRLQLGPMCFKNAHKLDTLKVFIGICPDLAPHTYNGLNYVHYAVIHGRVHWLEYLVQSGYDINQRDGEGNTPLLWINPQNPLQLTRILLENGADGFAVNQNGENVVQRLTTRSQKDNIDNADDWTTYMLEKGYAELFTTW